MAAALRPEQVAGVLDQVYRAATGAPRRFYLSNQRLSQLAGRTRALRPEFFEKMGFELEYCHTILISYPRLDPGGTLGFVSTVFAEQWPATKADCLEEVVNAHASADWARAARMRLVKLHDACEDVFLISEKQLCRVVKKSKFQKTWWSDLMAVFARAVGRERLVFFMYGSNKERMFAVTNYQHITTWYHPKDDDWDAALSRYRLDESD